MPELRLVHDADADAPERAREPEPPRVPSWMRRSMLLDVGTFALSAGLAVIGAAAGTAAARLDRVFLLVVLAVIIVAADAARPDDRWARTRRAVAVLLVVAADTVAATIAVSHARAVGWSVRSVAGWVAFVGGVLVLGVLVRSSIHRTHGWRRLGAVPMALALLVFVVYPVFVAIYATAQPARALGHETPADRGLPYDDVIATTADGVHLSGWYLPSTNGAAVVLLHGASSTRSAVLDQAEALNRAGYGVLLIDARGHGRSGGSPMDLGWAGDADVRAAIDVLVTRGDVDPARIGAVGMSMGGEEAIGAAASDPRIRAVVAEGAQNRTYEDRALWLPHGLDGWLQRRMDRLAYALTDVVASVDEPIGLRAAAMLTAPRPILLLVGNGELAAARSIEQGAPDSVTIWETGVGHIRGLADRPADWTDRVVGFLDATLAPI